MIACPFEIPAYEYFKPLTPRVRKCEFCTTRTPEGDRANPACARSCPVEAILFGRRGDLVRRARKIIRSKPDRYLNHIYGETEVGGTSWLYLIGRPQQEIGLLSLPEQAPPRTTEGIQHGIFEYGIIPVALYGALGTLLWRNHRLEKIRDEESPRHPSPYADGA
jgi:ferredoxin